MKESETSFQICLSHLGLLFFFSGGAWAILGIALVILSQLPFSIDIGFIVSSVRNLRHRIESQRAAESLYKEDNSLGNLEFDLDNLLERLWKEEIKIVFVIDELDKIEKDSAEPVFSIIRTYKNLFTLSYALFIFITSDLIFFDVAKARASRLSHYTLFTNKMFINRPSFTDLEHFIKVIIERVDASNNGTGNLINWESSKDFKNFKNFLCFNARSDYFDLYMTIRDFITGYEESNGNYLPVIDLPKFDDFEKLLKSKLQKALGQIYEHNRFVLPSEWHRNDGLLKKLYSFLEDNFYRDFTFSTEYIDSSDRMVGEDLIPYLERLQVIQEVKRTPSLVPLQGHAVVTPGAEIVSYQWTGKIPGEANIPEISSSPEKLFNEEGEFLRIATDYVQQVNDIDDILSLVKSESPIRNRYKVEDSIAGGRDGQEFTGIGAETIFKKYEPKIEGLRQSMPRHIPRQDLTAYTKELRAELQKVKDVSLKTFTNILKKNLTNSSYNHASTSLANEPDLFQSVPDIRNQLIGSSVANFVIYSMDPPKAKQLLITLNLNPEVLTQENIKLLDQNKSCRVVNIQTSDDLDYTGKDELEYQSTRYIKTKGRGGKMRRKRVTEVLRKKIPGLINIKVENDYTVFVGPIKELTQWFRG